MDHDSDIVLNKRDASDCALAFFVGNQEVGSVQSVTTHHGYMRGRLDLDESFNMRQLFQLAVKLAAEANNADPNEFPVKWERWNQSCRELTDLHISIGSLQAAVLDIELRADWTIDWSFCDDELLEE